MKEKIAQIGTFDVENFGDLLFANVLEFFLYEYDIDIFSPRGRCEKPFEKGKYVYSIDDLEDQCREKEYRALIIGGGDIIRSDVQATSVYDIRKSISFELWTKVIMIGNKYEIPVLFNAPGVPFEFNKNMRPFIGKMLECCSYIAVRDEMSAYYLNQCTDRKINVVPDTVLAIDKLYSKNELDKHRSFLKEKISLPADGTYVVVQHNCCNINDECYVDQLKDVICHIEEKKFKIVLLPIGYVHKDILFLKKLHSSEDTDQFLIEDKLTPVDMAAVLAGSAGYVGTSMHGAVISYCYGKIAICINTSNYSKISGLLKNIGHPEWEVQDIRDVEEKFNNAFDKTVEYDLSIEDRINYHFRKMKCVIQRGKTDRNIPQILSDIYDLENKLENNVAKVFTDAKVYFDMGNGFSEERSIHVRYQENIELEQYYFSLVIPAGTKRVRIDPIELALISVKDLKIQIGEKRVEPFIDNLLPIGDDKVIVSTDPQFIFSIEAKEKTKMEYVFCGKVLTLSEVQDILGRMNYQKNIEILSYKEEIVKREKNEKILIRKYKKTRWMKKNRRL